MKFLVWQWGRRGAGPRYAVQLADGLRGLDATTAMLSLSTQAEILRSAHPPVCELPFPTYGSLAGFLVRLALMPLQIGSLAARLRALRPDVAICAMPGPLDLLMARALHRAGVPFLVVVHDADLHPGDGLPLQMTLQRRLVQEADGLIALTSHVAAHLRAQGFVGNRPLIMTSLPPMTFGPLPEPPRAHGGKLRLLSFGRLRPYKGLDLLADALRLLGPRPDLEVRVVGHGPESAVLDALRRTPGVSVENRWVPEAEVGDLLAWSDALVLSHREASQSGVAAAAIAARRWLVATRVGGMTEQLGDEPLARMCDPTPESLSAVLAQLLDNPPPPAAQDAARTTWGDVAADMAGQIRAAFAR
ncbi:glycosyltransferase [Limobrevibacterium gyesilva]|uniref:Glycosyltransferase n=1 Tax=Limobrevibacterium gyesilva TaxID=2991712 RepID=A0AA41YPN5_9PROT|nr:glycosyltransferase [Limobrevibacterium gyesilva]MCW3475948.1 glycosyltransferase [Limobrevibacterium gyesilva]